MSDRYLELGQSCPGSSVSDQVIIVYGLPLSQKEHLWHETQAHFMQNPVATFSLSGIWRFLSVPNILFGLSWWLIR